MQIVNSHNNLIDFWQEQMRAYKWKNGLIKTSPFSEIDLIVEKLESFFPRSDFDLENSKHFRNNFIASYLMSDDPKSIYFLAEHASYIDYIQEHPDLELNKLALKSNINYPEIRNRFFEIFINRNLELNGLNPNLSGSYKKNGNIKPLDSLLKFNETNYLVECLKISDVKKELISDLVFEIIRYQKKYSQPFHHEELMGGFLQFKKLNITPKGKQIAIENFRKSIQKYFQTFRNNSGDTLKAYIKFSDENVHIELMPVNVFNSKRQIILDSIDDGITFYHSLTGEIQGMLRSNYNVKLSHSGLDELIRSKIHKKKRQHRDSSFDKIIIAIEIERSNSLNHLHNSIPADIKLFESKKITNLIDDNTAILVVLRHFKQTEMKFEIGLVSNNNFDPKLNSRLTKMRIKWR